MYKDDYLAHYGVLGMKWGVRRYQNKDGTLTARGKAKKRVEDMSDEELRSRINRIRMEQDYKKLSATTVSRGKSAVGIILGGAATVAATTVATAYFKKGFKTSADAIGYKVMSTKYPKKIAKRVKEAFEVNG